MNNNRRRPSDGRDMQNGFRAGARRAVGADSGDGTNLRPHATSDALPSSLPAVAHPTIQEASSERAGAQLSDLNDAPTYQAVLSYAADGWPVFPVAGIINGHCGCRAGPMCDHPGKHPLNRNGLRAATTDVEQLRQWWHTWPQAGVAIRTGTPSGLVVVDIDPAHGGLLSLDEMTRGGRLPSRTLETLQVRTGGAGLHLYYRHPGNTVPNTTGQLPTVGPTAGIDLRGDGGYIIAPPSLHHSGRRYQWELTSPAPIEIPSWAQPAPLTPRPPPPRITIEGRDRLARYAQAALQREAAVVASAPEGQRNHILNRAAFKLGTLVGAGALDQTVVAASLADAAATAGLRPREIIATVESGLASGIAHPRQLSAPIPTVGPTAPMGPAPTAAPRIDLAP